MSEYLIQGSTLQEIADAIRSKTKSTESIAVSGMAEAINSISERVILDEGILKHFAFNANSETGVITIYKILYDRIYDDTGRYDVTIPDEIFGYKVVLSVEC